MVASAGKSAAAWDDAAQAAAPDKERPLLFAWQGAQTALRLAEAGYDVVVTPQSAYYLDIRQSDDWDAPGAHWVDPVAVTDTYEFAVPNALSVSGRIRGIQACVWCGLIRDRETFNHMVFPRLGAVAESGWTTPEAKNFQRFMKQAARLPKL